MNKGIFCLLICGSSLSFSNEKVHKLFSNVSVFPRLVKSGETIQVYYKPTDAKLSHYVHYGFNGWNFPTSGLGSGSEDDSGNKSYFYHKKMKKQA